MRRVPPVTPATADPNAHCVSCCLGMQVGRLTLAMSSVCLQMPVPKAAAPYSPLLNHSPGSHSHSGLHPQTATLRRACFLPDTEDALHERFAPPSAPSFSAAMREASALAAVPAAAPAGGCAAPPGGGNSAAAGTAAAAASGWAVGVGSGIRPGGPLAALWRAWELLRDDCLAAVSYCQEQYKPLGLHHGARQAYCIAAVYSCCVNCGLRGRRSQPGWGVWLLLGRGRPEEGWMVEVAGGAFGDILVTLCCLQALPAAVSSGSCL